MIRLSLLATVLLSTAALATGERISVTGAAAALKDTLCISMTCVAGGPKEFIVTGRPVSGGVEVTVTTTSGQKRLTHVAKVNEANQISSVDLVRASSLVLRSIERGPIASPDAPKVSAAKKPRAKALLARR